MLLVFEPLDVITLARRFFGPRGRLLGSASLGGRASAHPAKFVPTYTLALRSPVSRPAAIATGRLSKGGRGHKSYEGGDQHSIEVAHGLPVVDVHVHAAAH